MDLRIPGLLMIYIAPCQSVWPGLVVNPVKTAPYFLVLSRLFVMSHLGFFLIFLPCNYFISP